MRAFDLPARSPRAANAERPLLLQARGVRVAFLSYTQMTNGIPLPHRWSVNIARAGRILRDARRARRAGARVVIVNLHWGTEYRHAPDAFQLALARRLARSHAITAVVGQHAHVVQPIRRIGRLWVVFGAGNLLSNQTAACCPAASQDGMLVRLHLRVTPRQRARRADHIHADVGAPPRLRGRPCRPERARVVASHGGGGRPLPPGPAVALAALPRSWQRVSGGIRHGCPLLGQRTWCAVRCAQRPGRASRDDERAAHLLAPCSPENRAEFMHTRGRIYDALTRVAS